MMCVPPYTLPSGLSLAKAWQFQKAKRREGKLLLKSDSNVKT